MGSQDVTAKIRTMRRIPLEHSAQCGYIYVINTARGATTEGTEMAQILNSLMIETGCTREQAISAVILRLVDDGATVRGAIDAVLGAGTFEKIASDTYDALRAA